MWSFLRGLFAFRRRPTMPLRPAAIRKDEVYESASGRFTYVVEDVTPDGWVLYACPEENKRGKVEIDEFCRDRVARRVPVELIHRQ